MESMSRSRSLTSLLVAGALCATACASSVDGDGESVVSTDDRVVATDPATTVPSSVAVTDSTSDSTTTSAPTTSPSTSTTLLAIPPTTVAAGSDVDPDELPDDQESDGEFDEEFDDEPSFELGPEVVLDVDLARFPPDDAGIGTDPETSVPPGQPDPEELVGWAGFDASLAAALVRPGNTAASVAVSIDGDIVHRAAFGERDPATGDPAEPQDRFRIASISKPITAIVVLQLVGAGVIALDDPVGGVVAEYLGVSAGRSANLTLRQLLTHRSGFGKYQSTFFRGGASDCADAARQGLSSGASGGGYVYSNMNYCIAGVAIEALTGLSYERAIYQYLLTPLGISGMRLAPTIDPGPDEAQHVTTPGRNYMETLGGAGGWVATPSDLVTIFNALNTSTPGFSPLPIETVLAMFSPGGGQFGQRGYGLGVISYGGGRFGHTGTIESTHAMVLDRGDGVVWALTVAGQTPSESTDIERIVNNAFVAGGFVSE